MLFSEKEISLIQSLAKDNGYEGFLDGKYYCTEGRVLNSDNKILAELGFPAVLNQEGLLRVFIAYKDLKIPICRALAKVKLPRREFSVDNSIASLDSSMRQVEAVRENILLMKTARLADIHDPKAANYGLAIIAFNKTTREIINSPVMNIDGMLRMRGTSREEVMASENIPYVWPEFHPYRTEITFEKFERSISEDISILNTFRPPQWMTEANKEVGPELTGFIGKLVHHLFPYEPDREAVLDWCHWALKERVGTVLCLAGARGTGKSTFIEILSHIIGDHYTELVNSAILEDKFNAQFFNKRLIVFEEVALDEDLAINKIKAWCNKKISIEQKGSDAFSAENFSSMIFLINNLSQLKIGAQERRFSIPVVAERNLWNTVSEQEIGEFKKRLEERTPESLDELAAFGLFLKERKPKLSQYAPIRGPNFDRVADLALTEWQAHLREYVKTNGKAGEPLHITHIFPTPKEGDKDALKFPMKRSSIESFIGDYQYIGKYKIGEVIDHELPNTNLRKDAPHMTNKSRSRRNYGVVPYADFLEAVRTNKTLEDEINPLDVL